MLRVHAARCLRQSWTRYAAASTSAAPPAPVAASSSSSSTSSGGARPSKKHKKPKTKAPMPPLSVPLSLQQRPPHATSASGVGSSSSSVSKEGFEAGYVVALTTAESYDTAALFESLAAQGLLEGDDEAGPAVNLMGEAIFLPTWSPPPSSSTPVQGSEARPKGQVFIFDSGTIVVWGLDVNAADVFLRNVIRGPSKSGKALNFVEKGRYTSPETEVLQYYITENSTKVTGDAIFVAADSPAATTPSTSAVPAPPSRNLLVRLAFSAGMARVTKLGVYEEQFDTFAEGVAGVAKQLESGSEAPVKKKDIIRSVGTLHGFRQKLNLEDENLLDEPEFLWEDATLHRCYTSICNALDFDSRLTTLNQRVDYAFQLQSTLMDLLNTSTSHRLEWIIILLIAFEICLVLYREGIPGLTAGSAHAHDRDERDRFDYDKRSIAADEPIRPQRPLV